MLSRHRSRRDRQQDRLFLALGLVSLAAAAAGVAGFLTGFAKQPMAALGLGLFLALGGLVLLAAAVWPDER